MFDHPQVIKIGHRPAKTRARRPEQEEVIFSLQVIQSTGEGWRRELSLGTSETEYHHSMLSGSYIIILYFAITYILRTEVFDIII